MPSRPYTSPSLHAGRAARTPLRPTRIATLLLAAAACITAAPGYVDDALDPCADAYATVAEAPPAYPPATEASPPPTDTPPSERPTRMAAGWLFHETDKKGADVVGVGMLMGVNDAGAGWYPYLGMAALQLEAPNVTYAGKPDTLQSLYGVAGVAGSWPIAPYAEVGVDLGDLLVEILEAQLDGTTTDTSDPDNPEPSRPGITDMYASIGVQLRLFRPGVLVRGYRKWYLVAQEGRDVSVSVTGIAVGVQF